MTTEQKQRYDKLRKQVKEYGLLSLNNDDRLFYKQFR